MVETTGTTLNLQENPKKPVWNISVQVPSEYTPTRVTAVNTHPLGKTTEVVFILGHRQTPIRKGVSLQLIVHGAVKTYRGSGNNPLIQTLLQDRGGPAALP